MRFVESQPSSAMSRWTSRLALFSLVVLLTAAFLHRIFGMPTPVAFNLVKLAYAGASGAFVMGLAAAVGIWRHGTPGAARVFVGLLVSSAMLAAPLLLLPSVAQYPKINDVTTDVQSPPEFSSLVRRRGPGANPAIYPGESFAQEQARAYPDLKPMVLDRSREEAFELAAEAVRKLRMDIVREDAPGDDPGQPGMIEAVDRTLILGFYDDVAIRVTGNETSARVDIRSASRFGRFDLGRNAERIRSLMREIVTRLESTVPTAEGERPKGAKHAPGSLLKRGKEGASNSALPRKSRDRARSDAQREPAQKEKPPTKDEGRSRDKRGGQSFE
jgi:uncharacterized protein (DUF1499 family)